MKNLSASRPRRFTESELAKVGIRLVDPENRFLFCPECNQGFQALIKPGGGLYRRYWVCPNGCNDPRSK